MVNWIRKAAATAVAALVIAVSVAAQERSGNPPPPPPPPAAPTAPKPPAPPPTPPPPPQVSGRLMRCAVVLSRFQGEKKVTSLPYELLVSAGQPAIPPQGAPRVSLRVGVEMWLANQSTRFVGTSIDCAVVDGPGGAYGVYLNLEDSALTPSGDGRVGPQGVRTYRVTNVLTVTEGRPLQFSVGTDQFSGETTRAEVTVTAVK